MTYKNPQIPLIAVPQGIDKPIQQIQEALGNGLSWLERSYGRARRGRQRRKNNREYFFPEVYEANGEYHPVEPNDNLSATSFFRLDGAEPIDPDYDPAVYNKFIARVWNIFWFNLPLIDNTLDYQFDQVLKNEILLVYQTIPVQQRILNVWHEPEDVYRTYTIDHTERQTDKYPYDILAFELEISYEEDCLI